MRFQTLKIEANAKEAFSFGAGKNYIKVWSVSVPGTVVYVERTDDGQVVPLVLGDDATLEDFDSLFFSHDKPTEVTITVLIGRDTRHRSAGVVGDVNALTRFDNLTKDGNQFFAGTQVAASASNYTCQAIYNPVGSGVTAYVPYLLFNALGTVVTINKIDATDRALGWLVESFGLNKQINSADSRCEFLIDWKAAIPGIDLFRFPTDTYGTPSQVAYGNAPIEIGEGEGLLFSPNAVNQQLTVLADFWEE